MILDNKPYSLEDLVEYWFVKCMDIYEDNIEYSNENKRILDYQEAYTTFLFYERFLLDIDITYRIAKKVHKHFDYIVIDVDDYVQEYVYSYGVEIDSIDEDKAVKNVIERIKEDRQKYKKNTRTRGEDFLLGGEPSRD